MIEPDRDLERRLRRWLVETGRPLPADVLIDAVSRLPRTAQERARPWQVQRWVKVAASAVVVVLVVGVSSAAWKILPAGKWVSPTIATTPSTPPLAGFIWDVATDFGHGSGHANPTGDRYGNAGVWSYRFAPSGAKDPATHELMTDFDPSNDKWSAAGFANLHVYVDVNALLLHPYRAGSDSRAAIADWASPMGGRVRIQGRFAHVQGCAVPNDGVLVAVDLDGQTRWSEPLQPMASASFDITAVVQPGLVVSFRVDPAEDSSCDSTDLTVQVRME